MRKKTGRNKKTVKKNVFFTLKLLWERNEASDNARNGLRISENCNLIPNMSIQRTAPLLSIPRSKIIESRINEIM
jgi:hypothetical protein